MPFAHSHRFRCYPFPAHSRLFVYRWHSSKIRGAIVISARKRRSMWFRPLLRDRVMNVIVRGAHRIETMAGMAVVTSKRTPDVLYNLMPSSPPTFVSVRFTRAAHYSDARSLHRTFVELLVVSRPTCVISRHLRLANLLFIKYIHKKLREKSSSVFSSVMTAVNAARASARVHEFLSGVYRYSRLSLFDF